MSFRFFLFPILIFGDLIKSTLNPQTRRSTVILISVLMATCLACFGATSVVSTIGGVNTPASTVDVNAISTDAMNRAWSAYTQTAESLSTFTITSTPLPTNTILVTETLLPAATSTVLPTATLTPRPTFTPQLILQASNTPQIPVSGGAGGNCDPSYPTVCIPPAPPDLNCKDIPYRRFQVLPPDPHDFDREGDGLGCES